MHERIHDALATHAEEYEVRRRLHDVPPYEVYEATVDGRRAVCKLNAHPEADAATEGYVTRYAGRETAVPVPEVLAVGEDHYLQAFEEAVPAPGEGAGAGLESWARAAGAGLARLHADAAFDRTGVPAAGEDGLAVRDHDAWAGTLRAFLRRRRSYLAERGRDEAAALANDAVAFLEERPEVAATDAGPVLCHGNWLPDHVGLRDGDVAAVVDFEHALVAPAEYDYWRTAMPAFGGPGEGADAESAFRAGYESVRPLPAALDERRPLYAAVNGVSYLRSLSLQDRHDPEETERRAERLRQGVRERLDELRGSR